MYWEKFLEEANGDDIWAIPCYTKPQRVTAVPTISHQGVLDEDVTTKANMLVDISFPQTLNYTGDEGHSNQPGTAYQGVNSRLLQRVFPSTSRKKSSGPDGIGPLAITISFSSIGSQKGLYRLFEYIFGLESILTDGSWPKG